MSTLAKLLAVAVLVAMAGCEGGHSPRRARLTAAEHESVRTRNVEASERWRGYYNDRATERHFNGQGSGPLILH